MAYGPHFYLNIRHYTQEPASSGLLWNRYLRIDMTFFYRDPWLITACDLGRIGGKNWALQEVYGLAQLKRDVWYGRSSQKMP